MGRLTRTIAAALAVAAAAAAVAAAAGQSLTPGSYQATITGASPAVLNGNWKILLAVGRYTISRNGADAIDGVASIHGNQVVFKDKSGPFRCLGTQANGTYRWTLTGKKLQLAVVHDTCAGRKAVLGRPFTKTG